MPTIWHCRASVNPRRPPTTPTRSLRFMAAHLLCAWMARACHLETVTCILPDSVAGFKGAALFGSALFVSPRAFPLATGLFHYTVWSTPWRRRATPALPYIILL